jgi:FemAB-related protein (PEP-CTERM system-associated)
MTAWTEFGVLADRAPQEWNEYVARHPAARAYHIATWATTVSRLFSLPAYFLTARDDQDRIIGVLPLLRQKSWIFGDRLVSLPYFNYGGALADDAVTHEGLLEHAAALGRELGVKEIEVRETHPPPISWPQRQDKATLVLDLPSTVVDLNQQLGSKLRSQVKRALREQPKAIFGAGELLDDFYGVFAEVMRDHGTPVYPRRFFAVLLQELAAECVIVVLRLDGRPVSAAFLVRHRDQLEIPWAATLAAVRSRSINMALYWEVLRYAVENRYPTFDFGRSTVDSGPYRFKLQWGARPVPLHWACWRPDDSQATTIEVSDGRARAIATRIWSHLPTPVANRLGPLISPSLPW